MQFLFICALELKSCFNLCENTHIHVPSWIRVCIKYQVIHFYPVLIRIITLTFCDIPLNVVKNNQKWHFFQVFKIRMCPQASSRTKLIYFVWYQMILDFHRWQRLRIYFSVQWTKNLCLLLIKKKKNALCMTSQLLLWKSNQVIIYRFLACCIFV